MKPTTSARIGGCPGARSLASIWQTEPTGTRRPATSSTRPATRTRRPTLSSGTGSLAKPRRSPKNRCQFAVVASARVSTGELIFSVIGTLLALVLPVIAAGLVLVALAWGVMRLSRRRPAAAQPLKQVS